MAHFDSIGEFGLGQLLAKRLTTPGGAVAPTVAPEMFPVITMENDRPEWGWLKGELIGCKYSTVVAVAAEYSMLQYYLPSTAKSIAVIDRIQFNNTVDTFVGQLVGISGGLGGWVATVNNPRDFRWTPQRTQLICEQNDNVAQPAFHGGLFRNSAVTGLLEVPIVIAPGTALGIWTAAVNTEIRVTVSWRERGAQPGELV